MRRILCWLGLHRWGPASTHILGPRTIVYVYICERCGKKVEGRERWRRDKDRRGGLFRGEL